MSREQAIRYLVDQGYDETEAASIVTTLEANLSVGSFDDLVRAVPAGGDPTSAALTAVQAVAGGNREAGASEPADAAADAEAAVEGGDRNGDGDVDVQESQDQQVREGIAGALTDDDPANDQQAIVAAAQLGAVPPEVLQYFGGETPSPAQIEEAIEAYNELNPGTPIENAEELWNRWMSGDASAQVAVEAVAPVRPSDWVEIQVGTGDSVRVRGSAYRTLVDSFGDGFIRSQNVIFGAVRDSGRRMPASALAGALAVAGVLEPVRPLGDKFQEKAGGETEALVVLNAYEAARQRGVLGDRSPRIRTSGRPSSEAAAEVLEAFAENPEFQAVLEELRGNEAFMGGIARAGERTVDPAARRTGQDREGRQAARAVGARRRYEAYYRQFNNHGLALVAMRNDKLAEQIFENPQAALANPRVATMVEQIFLDAGYTREQWNAQGDAFDGDLWGSLLGSAGGRGGPQVEVVNLPDDAALEESMRNLWRAWFRRDPSAEELAGFTTHIDGLFTAEAQRVQAEAGAGGAGNPFKPEPGGAPANLVFSRNVDAGAELMQRARQSQDYRRLYGKKPSHLSEEEYAQRFDQTARSFAGNTVTSDDAVGAGMESGDTNTVTGRLLMNPEVFDQSSTFRDRMFRAARVFREVLG